MSPTQSAASPLRYVTPGQLAGCLLLFFLPWINVQCNVNAGGQKGGSGADEAKGKSTGSAEPPVWMTVASQSGLQIATGGVSVMGADIGAMGGRGKAKADTPKDTVDSGVLVWLFPIAVIGGIVVGFVMPSTGTRKMILAACCSVAFLAVAGQAVIGFPIQKAMDEDATKKLGGETGGKAPGGKEAEEMTKAFQQKMKESVRVSYNIWFYLALLLCVGGLATALLEPIGPGTGSKKRSKYDFDGEDDGEPLPPEDEERDEEKPRKRDRGEKGENRGGKPKGDNPFENLE